MHSYLNSFWIVSLFVSLLVLYADGELYCFKQLHLPRDEANRKPSLCRELINKTSETGEQRSYKSPKGCCRNGGAGFAKDRLVPKGRKKSKFVCSSCDQLKSLTVPETTNAPTTSRLPAPVDLFLGNPNRTGWSSWGEWSQCSLTCKVGLTVRRRICESNCDGGLNVEHAQCVLNQDCPVNGGWGPWNEWSECSVTCTGGNKTRLRRCNDPIPMHGGLDCVGDLRETLECNTDPCPVLGGWSEWSEGNCSTTCGAGILEQRRLCNNPTPSHSGLACMGPDTNYTRCPNLRPCPVDGGWSLWYKWGPCDITCGSGTRRRIRKCVAPKPRHDGIPCPGESYEEPTCYHSTPCPVDGGWTDWDPWGQCLATPCSGERGYNNRKRTCKNPQPRFNGKPCTGNNTQTQSCLNNENCPVNGGWCAWSNYTDCQASNSGKFKLRTRDCGCPTPESGGLPCTGIDFEVEKCGFGLLCREIVTDDAIDDSDSLQESSGFYEEYDC